MRYRRMVGRFGPFWKGVIFDREYKNLDDIVSRGNRLFPLFDDGCKWHAAKSDYKWTWPTGEELLIRSIKKKEDYNNFHGQEFCLAVGELVCLRRGDVQIETVRVGDEILTAEGYRPVTRVFPRKVANCNFVVVFDRNGELVGEQIQSVDHRVLTSDRSTFVALRATPTDATTVREIALLPPDVLRQTLRLRADGLGRVGIDSCELSTYTHPYSHEKRVAAVSFQVGRCVVLPCGPRETIDIEVEDTNSYITPSGILSSNCFIGWNELTKFPTSELYDKMMSCNRCGRPDVPLWVHSTTNPSGPGHSWVKKRFIDPAPAGKLIRVVTNAFNPATQQYEDVVTSRVRIFSSYKENPYLSPKYIAGLENISDENTKKAWLYGDWDVQGGGALDDVWGPWNIVPRFRIPASWRIDRSFDWGSSHPFSVGWWAQSSGEECVLPDGTRWAPPKNSLFRIFELYGSEEIGTNRGIKMSAVEIADLVAKYDHALFANGWIQSPVYPGPADNQINNVVEADSWTIAHRMSERGVNWTLSDKSRGARYTGLELFRQMLINSRRGEGPGIFFMDHCKAALETLPILPRDDEDPDDVDTTAEDHLYDECRYRILAGASNVVSELPVHYPR